MTQNKTNMTAEELAKSVVLKPCPFCGSAAMLWRGLFDDWVVRCTGCTAQMYTNEDIPDPRIVVDMWNRRVANDAETSST